MFPKRCFGGGPGGDAPWPSSIRLWRWPLDAAQAQLDAWWPTLSSAEQVRADRFRFPVHRQRFIAAHGGMRAILGRCAGCDPAALRFAAGPVGKPALAGAGEGLHFSLSHSEALAVLAVTEIAPLGIDVEKIRPVTPGLAERHFAPDEIARLQALPPALREEAFFRCWTRKEAYIKATGRGLRTSLDGFSVSLAPDAPARLLRVAGAPGEAERWWMAGLSPAPGYAGALAMRPPARDRARLEVTTLAWEDGAA